MSEIKVPSLGESVVEAIISKWLKNEGETVTIGEPIVELETDKVNLEVPSDQEGVLTSIVKNEGDTVEIGDVLAMVGGAGEQPATNGAAPAAEAAPAEPVAVSAAEAVPAEPVAAPAVETTEVAAPTETAETAETLATPVALRVASENNVDVSKITGTGPGGRVTKEDVLSYLSTTAPTAPASTPISAPEPAASPPAPAPAKPAAARAPTPPTPPAPPVPSSDGRREERQRMSKRRQTIARRLVEAQQTAAMLTTFNEIDMSAVMDLRTARKEQFKERHGVSLGFMSFFTRAVVGALKAFPLLNAEIQGDEMIVKYYYDIGIAVGTEQGLVVPVLRDADRKNFAQIESGIAELAKRARNNELTLAELQGGTFSITNGGIYGSLMSTPILNAPQVGILGMHKIEQRPIVVNGEMVVRPMMYVALSYDHRIVDGGEAVSFLVKVKELVEDPEALLLEG